VVRNVNYNWSEMSEETAKKLNKIQLEDRVSDKKLDPNYLVVIPKYVKDNEKGVYIEHYKGLVND